MATQTTYTDPTGNKKTGYIQNGVTYTDASLSTRVPTGSVVETAGGTYYKGTSQPYGVKIDSASGNEDSYDLYGKSYKTYYGSGGSAYMDSDLTTKIPFGTTNTKNGSQYYNDELLGNVPTASGVLNNYYNGYGGIEKYLQEAANARAQASEVYTQQRIDELNSREAEIRQAKREADRQSYNTYLQASNPYGAAAQQTARMGLSGSGYSETAMTSLGNTYQQALAGNEQAKITALSEISRLADQARAEGDRQKYDALADMYESLYSTKIQSANTGAQLSMQVANMLNNKRTQDEEYAQQALSSALESEMRTVETRSRAAELVAKYLLSGELDIYQIASALGVTVADIRDLLAELY